MRILSTELSATSASPSRCRVGTVKRALVLSFVVRVTVPSREVVVSEPHELGQRR